MLEFIKMFGMGILYTILSPLILAFFLLFVVYSFGNYLVCEGIYLGGFFFGRRFLDKTKLELKYEKEKESNNEEEKEEQEIVQQIGGDSNE